MALTIVANIQAKADQVDFVKEELLKLIGPTRQEKGCLQYDLHQDDSDPAHFLFYENWESRELWQIHMNSAHLANYVKVTEDAIETFYVYEMSKIA